ncbi:MAG: cytochrome b [Pseudomonadota bacterium]
MTEATTATGKSESARYSALTRALHWLIAVHMIGLIALGWWMIDLSFYSSWYYTAPYLHKAFGVLVLLLGVIMLVWGWIKPRPPALSSHTVWEKTASRIAHAVLIISVLGIPISGYLFTTANGEGVSFFSLFTIPALTQVSDTVRDWMISFHYYASYGLIGVIVLHAGGALKHHFVDRDHTLIRMIKG